MLPKQELNNHENIPAGDLVFYDGAVAAFRWLGKKKGKPELFVHFFAQRRLILFYADEVVAAFFLKRFALRVLAQCSWTIPKSRGCRYWIDETGPPLR